MPSSPNLSPESKPPGGRYRLIQPLGAGGFGQTFRAQDLHLPGHPLCVVKQLHPQVTTAEELQVARRLFDTEAQTLYRLGSHPQIPGLLAHFEEDQDFYLAQEFIQGHALDHELEVAPWSEAQVVSFLGDLLGILAFVHQHGVIHRDIKPSNLMRRHSDNRIVLIDFGAVKQVSTQATYLRSGLSHTISIGTQGYMPSEQVAGRPQFSSDVYAVGMVGIQALTGHAPSQLSPDPHSGELDWQPDAPTVSAPLAAVLDTMVRYDFRSRYRNAAEALAALRALPPALNRYIPPEANPWGITPPPPTTQAQPTVAVGRSPQPTQATDGRATDGRLTHRRQPAAALWPLAAVAIAVIVAGGLLVWSFWRFTAADPAPESPEIVADSVEESELETEDAVPPLLPAPPEPEPEPPAPPEPELTAPSDPTTTDPSDPDPAATPALTPAAAQATVSTLYRHVSNQDWAAARSQFDGALAQQFDPNFFAQFDRVTVENLRVTNQTADRIEFLGENTYVYLDGSRQREERTFTVQTIDGQPRIVASSFQRVLTPR